MDISNIGPLAETAVMKLRHPATNEILQTDKGETMTITLFGRHTGKYRQAMREVAQSIADGDKDDNARTAAIIAKCTAEWTIQVDGKTPDIKSAADIYAKYNWMRDQADMFIHNERAGFLSSASGN